MYGLGLRGSSPLTRGKRGARRRHPRPRRLIPAHAGKTTPARSPSPATRAHPRSRGENRVGGKNPVVETGSSPLTRGKRGGVCGDCAPTGLIPAHAGKTILRPASIGASWAHPRSRGENPSRVIRKTPDLGSSPLTRGKQTPRTGLSEGRGLIPAHAGKTPFLRHHTRRRAAHPRSRGENWGR